MQHFATLLYLAFGILPSLAGVFETLPDSVQNDLLDRGQSEYELFDLTESLSTQQVQQMVSRGLALPGGVMNCVKPDSCMVLTYDDGPMDYRLDIVNTLKEAGAKATFFSNGYNYRCIYDAPWSDYVRQSVEMGFQQASHSWSHPDFSNLDKTAIIRQLTLMDEAFHRIAGVTPYFFRAPYGSCNDTCQAIVNDYGMVSVTWSVDTNDSDGGKTTTADRVGVYGSLHPGDHPIPLQHEVYNTSLEIVQKSLPVLKANGFKASDFVTVAHTLSAHPYRSKTKPGARDSKWTCAGSPQPGVG